MEGYKEPTLNEALAELVDNGCLTTEKASEMEELSNLIISELNGFFYSAMYAGLNNSFSASGKFLVGINTGYSYCIEIKFHNPYGGNCPTDGLTSYYHLFN